MEFHLTRGDIVLITMALLVAMALPSVMGVMQGKFDLR